MGPAPSDWTADRSSSFAVCDTEEVGFLRVGVGKVTNPALWVEPSKYMSVICLYKRDGGALVITGFVEPLGGVKLESNYAFFICLGFFSPRLGAFVNMLLKILPTLKFFLCVF